MNRIPANAKRLVSASLVLILTLVGVLASSGGAAAAKRNGSRIVWSRFEGPLSKRLQLVSARPNGSQLRVLTRPGKNTQDIDAQISPNGRLVAFERDLHGGETSRIALIRAGGKDEHSLDLGCVAPCVADDTPTWLPGGARIAFTPVIGPFDQVNHSARSAVLNTALRNGSDIQRLSQPGIDGKFEDYRARFSPDGSYVVFNRVRNAGPDIAVFRMNADGSNVRRLTPWRLGADVIDLSPATSGPTKNLIAFETYGMGPPKGKSPNVATVPSTCPSVAKCRRRVRYVTHYRGGAVQAFNPSWSPSGGRIAYVKFKPGDKHTPPAGDIWTARPDGSDRKPVSTSPLFEFRPDWGPAP